MAENMMEFVAVFPSVDIEVPFYITKLYEDSPVMLEMQIRLDLYSIVSRRGYRTDYRNPKSMRADCYRLVFDGTEVQRVLYKSYDVTPERALSKEAFEQLQTEMLSYVAPEFHGFIRETAWNDHHTDGYVRVIERVEDLIGALQPAIQTFERRISDAQSTS